MKENKFNVAWKQIGKIPDSHNAKEHYQLFIRKRHKISKTLRNTYQLKPFENPNNVDIKSIIAEHQKTSHKLSNTIRQAAKVGSNRSLYGDTKSFFKWKKHKNNKTSLCF